MRGRLRSHYRNHRRRDGPDPGDEEPRHHRGSGTRNCGCFVCPVYGVGLANVVLLPASTKIKARIESDTELKELKLEGVVGIVEGMNPKVIRHKLEAYLRQTKRPQEDP